MAWRSGIPGVNKRLNGVLVFSIFIMAFFKHVKENLHVHQHQLFLHQSNYSIRIHIHDLENSIKLSQFQILLRPSSTPRAM